jgi:hypothetical protein
VTADLITGADFVAMFDAVTTSARRLETRDRYAADQPRLERWIAGEIDAIPMDGARKVWLDRVRTTTAAGGNWRRVRVVRDPPTLGQRFLVMAARQSVEVGEDIRYITRTGANELDLPAHDFWLFDDDRLALLWFTADDRTLGAQIVRDEAVLRQHRRWLDRAEGIAAPYREYLAADPNRERRSG